MRTLASAEPWLHLLSQSCEPQVYSGPKVEGTNAKKFPETEKAWLHAERL